MRWHLLWPFVIFVGAVAAVVFLGPKTTEPPCPCCKTGFDGAFCQEFVNSDGVWKQVKSELEQIGAHEGKYVAGDPAMVTADGKIIQLVPQLRWGNPPMNYRELQREFEQKVRRMRDFYYVIVYDPFPGQLIQ